MKRHVKKVTDFIHSLTFWQLVVTIVIILPISLFALRSNNKTMGELKLDVVAADSNNENTQEALNKLAAYVFSHMNTSTEVELAQSYERAVEAAQRDAASNSSDPKLYEKAQRKCQDKLQSQRVPCIQEFVLANTDEINPQPITLPEKAFYVFAFSAPLWSPDLAGFSLAAVVVSLLLVVFKLLHKKDPA